MKKLKDFSLYKRIYWRFLREIGFEKIVWEQQYKAGIWSSRMRSKKIIEYVMKLGNTGKIVQFGCGEGELLLSLPEYNFSSYTGYDISEFAIENARRNIKNEKIFFYQKDMSEWHGDKKISLIILEECLNYLGKSKMKNFLLYCSNSLSIDGSILVTFHDLVKHSSSIKTCREICKVKEEYIENSRIYLILGEK